MHVVGRADVHRVEILVLLVEHLPPILVDFDLAFGQVFLDQFQTPKIDFRNADNLHVGKGGKTHHVPPGHAVGAEAGMADPLARRGGQRSRTKQGAAIPAAPECFKKERRQVRVRSMDSLPEANPIVVWDAGQRAKCQPARRSICHCNRTPGRNQAAASGAASGLTRIIHGTHNNPKRKRGLHHHLTSLTLRVRMVRRKTELRDHE